MKEGSVCSWTESENKYPPICCIKNYQGKDENGSLAFLKDFYINVWAKYQSYLENDKKLYEIFDKKHDENILVTEARVGLLDSMYRTQVTSINEILEIVKKFCKGERYKEGGFKDGCIERAIKLIEERNEEKAKERKDQNLEAVSKKDIREEISFFSKYCHWYNEVNNHKAMPIYDKNVRVGLACYNNDEEFEKIYENTYQSIRTYSTGEKALLDQVNKFITNLELYESGNLLGESRNITGINEKVSIYRLVDKFLWLTFKILVSKIEEKAKKNTEEYIKKGSKKTKKIQQTVPKEVMQGYEAIIGRIQSQKCKHLSDVKQK